MSARVLTDEPVRECADREAHCPAVTGNVLVVRQDEQRVRVTCRDVLKTKHRQEQNRYDFLQNKRISFSRRVNQFELNYASAKVVSIVVV